MKSTFRTTVALLTIASASSVFAHASAQSDQALHARYLRGEPLDQMVPAPTQAVPGPRAQHLIYLGVEPARAIEQARAEGESPRTASVPSRAPIAAGGYDMYARNAMAKAGSPGMVQAMR